MGNEKRWVSELTWQRGWDREKKVGNTNQKETPQRATAQVVCPDDLCGSTGAGVSPVIELNQRQSRPMGPWGRAAGHFGPP